MTLNDIIVRQRNVLSVILKDWRRYNRALTEHDSAYLALRNRNELLEAAPVGIGYRCDWRWTSDLHAPRFMPTLGMRLMKRALADHTIRRAEAPEDTTQESEISFVIGHRGVDRVPHLLATLESIAGQQNASLDCVVVDQEIHTSIKSRLPAWVRHIHTPPPSPKMPYCRSWAFNVGVQHSRGAVLVLHDNDMLVPVDYAANILKKVRQGYDVVNLKRFIFYLNERHTESVFAGKGELTDEAPHLIVQNLEAGGSVAISRKGYEQIGGMDESFIGWGGEDNEFWERAQTLRVWPYAYLPIVHLWHAAQPEKHQPHNGAQQKLKTLSDTPASERIAKLRRATAGAVQGPSGWKLDDCSRR
jgi:hypothetical protein